MSALECGFSRSMQQMGNSLWRYVLVCRGTVARIIVFGVKVVTATDEPMRSHSSAPNAEPSSLSFVNRRENLDHARL